MRARSVLLLTALGAFLCVGGPAAQRAATRPVARTAGPWAPPRTPWGDPDLQGIYTNKDENNTPFERPADLAGKRLSDFGPKEMALADRAAAGARGPAGGEHRRHDRQRYRRRTAALVRAPRRRQRAAVAGDRARGRHGAAADAGGAGSRGGASGGARKGRGPADSYTDRSLYDRCISRGVPDVMRPDHLRGVVRHHAGAGLRGRSATR